MTTININSLGEINANLGSKLFGVHILKKILNYNVRKQIAQSYLEFNFG